MARKIRVSRGKRMKPNFFVFCEGKTEIAYVKFLRSLYRVPIQVITKMSKSSISTEDIERSKRDYIGTDQDKVFLMFDLDVSDMLENLKKIPDAELLVSNPCIELWFLLHYQEQRTKILTDNCIQKLQKVSKEYKKGCLSDEEKRCFAVNVPLAVDRAQKMTEFENPSTTVYKLIEMLRHYIE